jgi:hypothetical protein
METRVGGSTDLVAAGTWSEVLVCQVELLYAQRADLFFLFIVDELVLY